MQHLLANSTLLRHNDEMALRIDPSQLPTPAQKIVAAGAPAKLQEMAAKGVVPGLKPNDIFCIIALLADSSNETIADLAHTTLRNPPSQLLQSALDTDLHPVVIDRLSKTHAEQIHVLERLLRMPQIAMDTVEDLALVANEPVAELLATNEERLLAHPRIIELLYLNKNTRMSTADRIVELATRNHVELRGIPAWREVSTAIQNELIICDPTGPTPDDLLFKETQKLSDALAMPQTEDTHFETDEGKEIVKEKFVPLYKRILTMTVSQKIRRAILGSKEERMLLIRDTNRIVAASVVRSPLIQEDEILMISRNRNVDDEVLRVIGSNPEWLKHYNVKKNLVENPKTPVLIASKLITHLRENDLRNLAKSKNVPGFVRDAARKHLERRKH